MHRVESSNYTVVDGKNQYTNGPPATTVSDKWLNSVQEEIANVVEGAGLVLKSAATDTVQNQMWQALQSFFTTYDYVVSTQVGFNSIIERVGANNYKIKDEYKSVFVKNVTGGFACQGALSFLSGGDSWGYIETNNCSTLSFEAGAYLGVGDTAFYLEVNTDDARLTNVDIRGIGTTATAGTRSFYLQANNVTFDRCRTQDRKVSSTFYSFQGSATDAHNLTSQYSGCQVMGIEGVTINIVAFYLCHNIKNAYVTTLSSSAGGQLFAFSYCERVTDSYASGFTSATGAVYGISNCSFVSGCTIKTMDSTSANIYGIRDSKYISNCLLDDLDTAGLIYGVRDSSFISGCNLKALTSSNNNVEGMFQCYQISACKIEDLDSPAIVYGFDACNQISACKVEDLDSTGDAVYGFYSCNQISACYAYDIQTTANASAIGFSTCKQLTGCQAKQIDCTNAGGGDATGFVSCQTISACFADDIDANGGNAIGFNACTVMTSCYPNDVDSSGGTAWGFLSCTYGAALFTSEGVNAGCDWIDTVDAQITNKVSTPNVWT